MLGFLPLLIYVLVAAANPIKRARQMLAENKGLTQKDYLVTHLPGLAENVPESEIPLMFAGQLPLYHENNTHYFFWKFVDRQKVERAQNRTIFWLNGGPGCLSMDGALMEAGPFRVNADREVTYNNGSWHRQGDIVFVDQPAGTGFSYSMDFDRELADVLWHFLTFLQRYFELFPEDVNNEILLAGESYAGQYIPYIADAVLARNRRLDSEKTGDSELSAADVKYNLRGLLIGNGYISPNEQGLSYVPFAVKAGLIDTNHPNWNDLLHAHEKCQKAVDRTSANNANHDANAFSVVDRTCDDVLNRLLEYTADALAPEYEQCTNMYDYTLKDSYPKCGMNWPPDLAYVSPFLAKEAVMSDLNLVFHKHWTECSGAVGSHLRAKNSAPAVDLLPDLLQHVEILLFHGNRDIICNYIGAELLIKKLEWGGQKGFSENALTYDWRHNGSVEGYVRSERNLTYVNVFDASHMVPFDKPEVSRAIVDLLYRDYDVRAEDGHKPELLTFPIDYVKPAADLGVTPTTADDATAQNTNSTSEVPTDAATNLTVLAELAAQSPVGTKPQNQPQSQISGIVRVIQLAVIVVLIWGVCALYSTYKSKPASIIKTKSTGRKKNVLWADELESAVKEPAKALSLIGKAFSKLTKPAETLGNYQRVDNEDIEMNEGIQVGDDFIIASDDEDVDVAVSREGR